MSAFVFYASKYGIISVFSTHVGLQGNADAETDLFTGGWR